jgi:hypothetical protein
MSFLNFHIVQSKAALTKLTIAFLLLLIHNLARLSKSTTITLSKVLAISCHNNLTMSQEKNRCWILSFSEHSWICIFVTIYHLNKQTWS